MIEGVEGGGGGGVKCTYECIKLLSREHGLKASHTTLVWYYKWYW